MSSKCCGVLIWAKTAPSFLQATKESVKFINSLLKAYWRSIEHSEKFNLLTFSVGELVGTTVGELEVGAPVGFDVENSVRFSVGNAVSVSVGLNVGDSVGLAVGNAVSTFVGLNVGISVGLFVGFVLGSSVGLLVGDAVGFTVGNAVSWMVGLNVGDSDSWPVGRTCCRRLCWFQSNFEN